MPTLDDLQAIVDQATAAGQRLKPLVEKMQARRLDVTAQALARAMRLSEKIHAGWPTTWTYRDFCTQRGVMEMDGVFLNGAPYPFPYRHPVACATCGFIAEAKDVEAEPEFARCVSVGITSGPWGDCEPPEWETICPACDAPEPFDVATKCSECDEYPCVCRVEDIDK